MAVGKELQHPVDHAAHTSTALLSPLKDAVSHGERILGTEGVRACGWGMCIGLREPFPPLTYLRKSRLQCEDVRMAKYEGGLVCDSWAYVRTVVHREEFAVHRGRLQDDLV